MPITYSKFVLVTGGGGGVMQLLSGKKKRTGRPMVTKILNLAFQQLSIDLWPDFQGHSKRNSRSVAY